MKTRKYTAEYTALNYDKILVERREYMRQAKAEKPELFRERNRTWWANNREEISARRTTVEAREKANSRFKTRYANDHRLVVHARMASAIHQAITKKKAGRKWEAITGYSLEALVRHLERQFTPGMSWDNMGDWHIDHIIPKSSFNYEDDTSEEFRACWALTNLRPLWAGENQKKHAKRTLLL